MCIGTFGAFWYSSFYNDLFSKVMQLGKPIDTREDELLSFVHTFNGFVLPVYYCSEGFKACLESIWS